VKLLSEQVAKIPALKNSMMNIKVATVDGFQGSECDIVILSCVRSHSHAMRGKIEKDSINFFALYHTTPLT
jgi:superfamily I DNA and/or RNA helicase